MRRGRLFVILFVVAAAVIVVISQVLRSQPPLVITVAASPLAHAWVAQAALTFTNAQNLSTGNQRISVTTEPIDDADVWLNRAGWSPSQHPDAWIPAVAISSTYATAAANIRLVEVSASTARTLMIWGAFSDRAAALTSDGARPLDWPEVQRAAEAVRWSALGAGQPGWGNFVFAMHRPNRTVDGLAVVLSAAAAQAGSADVAATLELAAFQTQFEQVVLSVPSFSTLGASPAATIAARNASVGEVAFLAESEWLANLSGHVINPANPIQFSYPAYGVTFTFPVYRWAEGSTPEQADAVARFAAFLTTAPQQEAAQGFGLRPAQGEATAGVFAGAAQYGVRVPLPASVEVEPPPFNSVQAAITWLNGLVR